MATSDHLRPDPPRQDAGGANDDPAPKRPGAFETPITAWRWFVVGAAGAVVSFVAGVAIVIFGGPPGSSILGVIPGTVVAGLLVKARSVARWIYAASATSLVFFGLCIVLFIPLYLWAHSGPR